MGLEARGLFEVDTFNDPELALSSFKPGLYELALDMRMPKMYGHAKEARHLDVSTVLGELCPVFYILY